MEPVRPILIDVPMPITTRRLILRPPQAGDGPELFAAIDESRAELQAWMPWPEHHAHPADSEANAREACADFILRKDLRMSIYEKASGKLAGSTGLSRIDWETRKFELGYWVRRSYGGKGLITEAAAALTLYAFTVLDARRLEIRCDADNMRSAAIPPRLGFELEARLHHDAMKENDKGPRDTLIYVRFDPKALPDVQAQWR